MSGHTRFKEFGYFCVLSIFIELEELDLILRFAGYDLFDEPSCYFFILHDKMIDIIDLLSDR
jgi:hypothetical protein